MQTKDMSKGGPNELAVEKDGKIVRKPRRPGFKSKMALIEIISRKQFTEQCGYEEVAARYGIKEHGLRQLYYLWKEGKVDLGRVQTHQEREINMRMQHELTLQLVKRHRSLVLVCYEKEILSAEKNAMTGKELAFSGKGLNECVKQLQLMMSLQRESEKGYLAIMEEMRAERDHRDAKSGEPIKEIETKVIHANDEEKALHLLRDIEPPPQPEIPVESHSP